MQELIRQGALDATTVNFEGEQGVMNNMISHYVNAHGDGNKLISAVIHDIWRFGDGEGLHFLFEGRLLTRSLWDLVSQTVISPGGQTEVFTQHITNLTEGSETFKDLVRDTTLNNMVLNDNENRSFTNMLIFLREFQKMTGFDRMIKFFKPTLSQPNGEMIKAQVSMSAILVNLGISDIQFGKGMIIATILGMAVTRNIPDDREPFNVVVDIVRAFQKKYTRDAERNQRFDYKPFTLLSKRVVNIQPREMLLIDTNYGRHIEPGYPQRLMVSRQYQFTITQDMNKLASNEQDQYIAQSMVRLVRDRIQAQVSSYTHDVIHEDTDITVIVGMILQLPQDETVRVPGQSSEDIMDRVGNNIQLAQEVLDEQMLYNEGWSKYITITFNIVWSQNAQQIDDNEDGLRNAITQRIEALAHQYDADELALSMIMNGIDRAILRKLNVRPMAYVNRALARPNVIQQLGADLRQPNVAVQPTHLIAIAPQIIDLVERIQGQINTNQTQPQDIIDQELQGRLTQERDQRAEQAWTDRLLQEREDRAERAWNDRLLQEREDRAERAWNERLAQEQSRNSRSSQERDERAEKAWNDRMQIQRGSRPNYTHEAPNSEFEGDNVDMDLNFDPTKKPRYFASSRPSDILFEEVFKREQSSSTNCVENTCNTLIRIFPDAGFIVTPDFFNMYRQIYQKTPLIGDSLRARLVLCEYENSDIVSQLRNMFRDQRLEVVVFYRQGHVFPCVVSTIENAQQAISLINKGIAQKNYGAMTFTSRQKDVKRGLKPTKIKINEKAMALYAKCRSNVYFDFETTLSQVDHQQQYRGLQQAFLVSLTIDIHMPLKDLAEILFNVDEGIQDVTLFTPFQLIWGLDCDVNLIERLQQIQQFVRDGCQPFNELIELRGSKCPAASDILNAISFNGSKFDNQFVVKGLMKIYGADWYKQVQIIGNLNDIKVMTHKGINFIDLRLMCGASSLDQFCKDMQIDLESSKKKIDFAKMKTFELATLNRQEIEDYCAHDTISLRELHVKVQVSLQQLVTRFVTEHSSVDPDKIFINTAGIFQGWVTISQLSLKIFRSVFCDFTFKATRNHAVSRVYRDSYRGGYTQAFIIGETPNDQPVFYMDFNSMYPFIMASTPFPIDLGVSEIIVRDTLTTLTSENFHQMTRMRRHHSALSIDPFTKIFNLKIEMQHFDIFMLTGFEFTKSCKAPNFGVTVKGRGTLYPRTFNAVGDDYVPVFGFQLQENFNIGILSHISFTKSVEFIPGSVIARPIFKTFDDFMFAARKDFKQQKNTSMATAVKLLINSLYGKFGQRQHDVEFFASTNDVEDSDTFEGLLLDSTANRKDIQLTPEGFMKGSVRLVPLIDINGIPLEVSRVILTGMESLDNDVGSFVVIASIITAIGRQMITNIINISRGNVYYSDTDSVMMDQEAFTDLCNNDIFTVDDSQFGALKNEYPLDRDSSKSAIAQIRVLNKKIYQVKVDGVWSSKFKGCTKPTSDIFESFMGSGIHRQVQTRFIKNTSSISIQDRNMSYRLRLSREVQSQPSNGYHITIPFESTDSYQTAYPSSKSYIAYVQGVWTPYQIL